MPNNVVVICIVFVLLVLTGCEAPRVSPMIRVGTLDVDGDVDFTAGTGVQVNSSTSADDLGLDAETIVNPRIDVDWDDLHLSAEGFQMEYEGDGILNGAVSWGNITINALTPVTSRWDLEMCRSHLTYDILSWDYLDIGVGGGGGLLKYDVEIRSKLADAWVGTDHDMPFGFLTLRAASEMEDFEALALVSGLGVSLEDEELSYLDAELNMGYRVFEADNCDGTVLVGYRFINLQYEYEQARRNVELNADFSGPFVGFRIRF